MFEFEVAAVATLAAVTVAATAAGAAVVIFTINWDFFMTFIFSNGSRSSSELI